MQLGAEERVSRRSWGKRINVSKIYCVSEILREKIETLFLK